jgi:hypothetical protein
MSTNTLNFATQNKWIAQIPLKQILDDVDDVSINLTGFDIPSIDINSIELQYKGIPVEVPGNVIQTSGKEITFNYIIDSNWLNYKALYSWVNNLSRLIKILKNEEYTTKVSIDEEFYKNFTLTITVHLLDEYKNRILEFKYYNCWIKSFAELSMNYNDEPVEMTHSFTIAYSNFEIVPIT